MLNRIYIFDFYGVICKDGLFRKVSFELYHLPYHKAYEYFCMKLQEYKYTYLIGYNKDGGSMLIHKAISRG